MDSNYEQKEALDEMNRQLTEQDRLVEAACARLGKLYYEKCQNNPEDWAQEEFANIQKEMDQLNEIKDKIYELKGIRLCPNCGQELPLDSVFCSNCGKILQAKKNSAMPEGALICSHCGSVILPGQKFCIRCGTRVDHSQDNAPSETNLQESVTTEPKVISVFPDEEKVSVPSQSAPSKNMCPNCGKVYPDDMKFCTSCGSRLIRS